MRDARAGTAFREEFALRSAESGRPSGAREQGAQDGCPGILRLHEAADGYLARVRLPGGRLDALALETLAEAAALGSDIVELTSRAGLQIRGLAEDAGAELARLLWSGGLLPSSTHERVRNIIAAPLAGRDPAALADVDATVEELDRKLCADPALAELPGRFLFALDDGAGGLDQLRADVQLTAERDRGRRVFRVGLDGRATSLAVPTQQAPDAALQAARGFLALRHESADRSWRVRELQGGAERLARQLDLELLERAPALPAAGASALQPAPALQPVPARGLAATRGRGLGLHIQRDGLFAVAALAPLARLGRVQLERLAELARGLGGGADGDGCVRVSPWRTLTFVDVPASVAVPLLDELRTMGLIASDDSGWSDLSACAGMGACARARADVRTAAARRALVRGPGSPLEHWSGCERRCGEPAGAAVRVVADERGLAVRRGGGAGGAAGVEQRVASTAAALELLERGSVPA